jgi:hypothetical protein
MIGKDLSLCEIYVDDIIFGSANQEFCEEFGKMMDDQKFEMSMNGQLSYFLGLQIKQRKNGSFVSQDKYIKDMLKKFKMEDAKPSRTHTATNGHLDWDASGEPVDQKVYRSMIRSQLYLTSLRPDVMFNVCICVRFQASPKESHLTAVKRTLRYLRHTPSVGLWYHK